MLEAYGPQLMTRPRHPSRPLHTAFVVFGGILAVTGALLALAGPLVSVGYAFFGVLLAWYGLFGRASGSGVALVNAAFAKLSQGQLAEAEALLDEAEDSIHLSHVLRPVYVQRAMIALRRGDTKAALVAADRAVQLPLGVIERDSARQHRMQAVALRAVVKGSEGNLDGATRDAERVLRDPDAVPQALARAVLAQAMVLERRGEKARLREHLSEHAYLLEVGTEPRERAVVRAMQRMLAAPTSTVYRVAPPHALREPGSEPSVSEWLEKIAPSLARFGPNETEGSTEGSSAAEQRHATDGQTPERPVRESGRRDRLTVAASSAAIGLLLATVLREASSGGGNVRTGAGSGLELLFMMLAVVAMVLWFRTVRARRDRRELVAASTTLARGDERAGQAALAKLSKDASELVAAEADLGLSSLAERRGDLEAALAHCERGLGRLSHYGARVAASDLLGPELAAQRAFLLTAMDRHDEAAEEIGALPEGFAFRPRAVFRVEVLRRARVWGVESAAEYLGAGAIDRMLSARDELLADVVRAAARPELAGPEEIRRLQGELRPGSSARAWLERVAPPALAAFERIDDEGHRPLEPGVARIAQPRDARAELEAEAEQEAARESEALDAVRGPPPFRTMRLASEPKSE